MGNRILLAGFTKRGPRDHDFVDDPTSVSFAKDLKLTLWLIAFRRGRRIGTLLTTSSTTSGPAWGSTIGHCKSEGHQLVVAVGSCASIAQVVKCEKKTVTVPVVQIFVIDLHTVVLDIEGEMKSDIGPSGEYD